MCKPGLNFQTKKESFGRFLGIQTPRIRPHPTPQQCDVIFCGWPHIDLRFHSVTNQCFSDWASAFHPRGATSAQCKINCKYFKERQLLLILPLCWVNQSWHRWCCIDDVLAIRTTVVTLWRWVEWTLKMLLQKELLTPDWKSKLASRESYASSKWWPTDSLTHCSALTEMKCRATSVAKKVYFNCSVRS